MKIVNGIVQFRPNFAQSAKKAPVQAVEAAPEPVEPEENYGDEEKVSEVVKSRKGGRGRRVKKA